MKLVKLWVFSSVLFLSSLLNALPLGSFQHVTNSPFGTGASPLSVAFSPLASGNLFAAVSNDGDNTVSVYAVNQSNGGYSEISGSPFPTGSLPTGVAFSLPVATGNLYFAVSNFGDNTVSVYSLNPITQLVMPVPGSPFAAGSSPTFVAFSPVVSGNLFAAVSNALDNTVSVYTVNTSTGAFSPISLSPFATGKSPYYLAFSPVASGSLFAAVSNLEDNTVSVYKVNTITGVFTPVYKSPFSTGSEPTGVAFSPVVSGNLFAAISNQSSNTVSVYKVNTTTGVFTPVSGSQFATGSNPTDVAFSPLISGNLFAAVPNDVDNTVSVYKVSIITGVFTQVSGSPFLTGNSPYDIAFSPLASGNLFAVVSNIGDNTVSVYEVNL
jgi:6-phosphogluconolactonase (cycloisomerase 2 family)